MRKTLNALLVTGGATVLWAVVCVIAVGAVTATCAAEQAFAAGGPGSAVSRVVVDSGDDGVGTVAVAPRAVARSVPRKVWIGGDSMAYQIESTLEAKLRAVGTVSVPSLCKSSSGIVRTDFMNWPNAARAQMKEFKPQATVFMIGTNDHQSITAKGSVYEFGSAGWKRIYRTRVAGIMKAMLSNGAKHVYWIGMPIMADADFGNAMKVLNAIYKSEAKKRDQVTYIDAWKLFSDSSGAYVSKWRASDGIHFDMSGVKRLAGVVVAKIKKDF